MTVPEVIATFARAWNAGDEAERLRLLNAACLPDALFVSPQGTNNGIAVMNESIGEFRHAFPAAVVTFGEPDEHGGYARVAWATHWNNGKPALTGEDFAEHAADGRISLMVSFDGGSQAAPAS